MNGSEAALNPGGYALDRAGDPADFEQILRRHERTVFRIAYRMLGNVADAQDAGQEVFLRLHKHLKSFDDSRAVGPWLYRVTVNVCNDQLRTRKRTTLLPDLVAPERTDEATDTAERRKIAAAALESLPEKERAAVVLRDIEGLSTSEVAEILGTSESTVRSQISTGRVKLTKFVEQVLRRHS